jgi:hypothetical protein
MEHFCINLDTKSDGFVLRNNHMGRNTVTAWKLKASNGLIIDNHFEAHGWCCLSLFMELMWQEGFAPRNILIHGNRFENRFGIMIGCGYPIKVPGGGPRYARRFEIRDNVFVHDPTGWALRLGTVENLTASGNTMPGPHPVELFEQPAAIHLSGNQYAHASPHVAKERADIVDDFALE